MKQLLKRLSSNTILGDSFKLASSHVVMFLLPLIVTPILSRVYTPDSFGDWGVFSSTYYIISVVLFLCYEYTIIKTSDSDYPSSVGLCFIVSGLMILLTLIVFILGGRLKVAYFESFLFRIPLIVYLIISAFTKVFNYIANRRELYWIMSAEYFLSGVSQAVFRIVFGLSLLFKNGLIAGTIASQILCLIFYLFFLKKEFNHVFFSSFSFNRIRRVAIENKKFPLFDTPSTLLSYAALNLPIIVLSLFFNKSEIGCFSIVVQLLLMPMSLIGSAIGRVYYQRISSQTNHFDYTTSITLQVFRITVILAVCPALFLAFGGDIVVSLFLGSKWTTAGSIALCLSLWSIPTLLTQPLLPLFRTCNKQDVMLVYDGLYFVLGIGSLVICCNSGLSLYCCIFIYSLACFIAKLFLLFEILRLANIRIKSIFNPILSLLYVSVIILVTYRFTRLLMG